MEYYLDIETTGFDPNKDKILTIQFQPIDKNTGNALGPLTVLKEWEQGEAEMVKTFFNIFKKWEFVPIGMNLSFEFRFLVTKFRNYCGAINYDYYYNDMPFVDMKHVLLFFNRGEFKGTGLDQFTLKKMSGKEIPNWYAAKEFLKIEEYIQNETEAFLHFYQFLVKRMPEVADEYKTSIGKQATL